MTIGINLCHSIYNSGYIIPIINLKFYKKMDLIKEKITSWCRGNQQTIDLHKTMTCVPLSLSTVDTRIETPEQAAKAFGQISGQQVDKEQVLRAIPICKGHPGPDWKLGTVFVLPFEDDGWLFVFEKDSAVGFLDKNMFDIQKENFKWEKSRKAGRKISFRLVATVIAIIIFSIIIALVN